jgi:hypothetical protein
MVSMDLKLLFFIDKRHQLLCNLLIFARETLRLVRIQTKNDFTLICSYPLHRPIPNRMD